MLVQVTDCKDGILESRQDESHAVFSRRQRSAAQCSAVQAEARRHGGTLTQTQVVSPEPCARHGPEPGVVGGRWRSIVELGSRGACSDWSTRPRTGIRWVETTRPDSQDVPGLCHGGCQHGRPLARWSGSGGSLCLWTSIVPLCPWPWHAWVCRVRALSCRVVCVDGRDGSILEDCTRWGRWYLGTGSIAEQTYGTPRPT